MNFYFYVAAPQTGNNGTVHLLLTSVIYLIVFPHNRNLIYFEQDGKTHGFVCRGFMSDSSEIEGLVFLFFGAIVAAAATAATIFFVVFVFHCLKALFQDLG